jgi:hypothetical protein
MNKVVAFTVLLKSSYEPSSGTNLRQEAVMASSALQLLNW